MKKILLASLFLLGSGFAFADWDVTTPLGSDPKSQGDDRIREIKVDVTAALTKEGTFPGADTSDPRFYWNPSTGTTAQRPSGSTEAVAGRVFINTSSNTLEIYNGSTWDAYEFVASSQITKTELAVNVAGDGILGGGGEALRLGFNPDQFEVTGDSVSFSEPMVLTGSITTNTDLRVDGVITSTGQPSFFAYLSADEDNKIGNDTSFVTINFDAEVYDQASNFSGSTFTASVAGKYIFTVNVNYHAETSHASEIMQFELKTTGMEFASEMIIKAAKNNLKISEVPISYLPRKGTSKLNSFGDGWRHAEKVF